MAAPSSLHASGSRPRRAAPRGGDDVAAVSRRRLLGWILAVAVLAAPWWNIPRDQADSAGMMAHLHAFFVDRDLLYDDEYARLGMSPLFAFVTDEGVVSNHWPSGATWLQAPGWGLGVLAAHVAAQLGIGRGDATGVIALLGLRAWAMLVLAAMAWIVARLAASGQHDRGTPSARRAGAAIAAAFVFATPLWHYAAEDPLRPHLWGAAVVLGLVAITMRPSLGSSHERIIALAALAGLATYVRPQLAPTLLLVWPELADVPMRERLKGIGLALGAFAIFPLAHLRLHAWMYGEQLGQYAGEVSYHFVPFLFSTHHGVLSWCPALVLGAAALALGAARRERTAWIVLVVLATQLWMDAGMREIEPRAVLGTRTWSGGLAFGPRKLVDVLPLLLPSVTSFVAAARARGLGTPLAALAVVLATPTILLHASAWIAPTATTGDVMGTAQYHAALLRPLEVAAWRAGYTPRALPWSVPLIVTACVTLPLIGLWLLARRPAVTTVATRDLRRAILAAVAVAGLLVHGWVAVLLVRSESILAADPERMVRAAAAMAPAHDATVRAIPSHHALLRERLGPAAAPPSRR
jgi:hypothetical protein